MKGCLSYPSKLPLEPNDVMSDYATFDCTDTDGASGALIADTAG
ncbi:hypothetical protein V473_01930 [Sphingobium cupriresistens LL01]|uniref:Uncharacterized protein n=1 Tax=Sphingobium cupriresistens LL01 TaxID=1420583 RepID=A0A0J7Y496_9SPHN|nr:hypothetical protein V473_01930 [Sphingobium cupriresistens LL01]